MAEPTTQPTVESPAKPASKSAAKHTVQPYKHGKGWAMRRRIQGHDIFVSGFETSAGAKKAMGARVALLSAGGKAKGLGPHHTTVGQALQDYATERLIFMKGAKQEANRINRFLRPAGLATLSVTPFEAPVTAVVKELGVPEDYVAPGKKAKPNNGQRFTVELVPPVDMRSIPKGLSKHRSALEASTPVSDRLRERLARMTVAEVQSYHVQELVNAYRAEEREASTISLERALIRGFFNHAKDVWKWPAPVSNPGVGLDMPPIDNCRDRVMSLHEQEQLDEAVQGCRNRLVGPTLTLLRESAMRTSEPLEHARWSDVNWTLNVLSLQDAKGGRRDVPLSPAAIDALRQLWELGRGESGDPIVHITYEALKASWARVSERAGVEGLRLHDFRHTAATRMALKIGNIFLVMALTGHKTLSQVSRYVNVKASDVVAVMHAEPPAPLPPTPLTLVERVERVGDRPLALAMGSVGEISFPQEWELERG